MFPEEDDQEYQLTEESDADERATEEYRNDRAVHIPRKEVNEIRRLADKELVAVPVHLGPHRPILSDQQHARLANAASRLVTLSAQLHETPSTRAHAASLLVCACLHKTSLPSPAKVHMHVHTK